MFSSDSCYNPRGRVFLVYESCLRALFSLCMFCRSPSLVFVKTSGTMATIEQACPNGHDYTWHSQPSVGSMPHGNLMLSACIFTSGCTVSKVLNCLKHFGLSIMDIRTYFNIQSSYIIPAVNHLWTRQQATIINEARQHGPLSLAGDGRCCSPGHTAKYGSYSLMDMRTGKIIDVQLVQVIV